MVFNNLIFSLNAVFPIFIILIIGYILKEKGVIDQYSIRKLNALMFNISLPMLLFRDIAGSNVREFFDLKLLLFAIGTTLISFVLVWIGAELFIKDKGSIGAFVQGAFRGNYALLGLVMVSNIGGSEALTKAALVTAFIIPLYNILVIIILTLRSEEGGSIGMKTTLMNIIKNPLIIGIACAIPFSLFNIQLPTVLAKSVDYMAVMATPLAMISIGGTIDLQQIKNQKIKLALVASTIKLIILPMIFIPIALLMGIVGNDLLVLFVMYGSPTAVSSYVMAINMKADAELASDIFIITTLFSIFTFTIGIYIFKVLGFIS
ncbi:AEC family transporter [Irregularibacter muris]|uniref:AEC family transporter n=1 Tax=Irregularibacter muris TaxID=1796619 RepID=A0AAE3HH95_9FIRM|nr:AEC family transporter [Irregularibacter muris]MCR1898553.1 AEC family transporter [Irregularibacter muris]